MNEIKPSLPTPVPITDTSNRAQEGQQNAVARGERPPVPPQDLVTVTSQAERLVELEKKLTDMPAVDSDRVAHLREAIASGTFRIDPEQIAFKLLRSEAETFSLVK